MYKARLANSEARWLVGYESFEANKINIYIRVLAFCIQTSCVDLNNTFADTFNDDS